MQADRGGDGGGEAGVSPVVGVILMVAITVVLSGVIFVVVNGLGTGTRSAPSPAFVSNDITDRLDVVSAPIGADWSRISVRTVSCTGIATVINIGGASAPHHDVEARLAAMTAVSVPACGGNNPVVQAAAIGSQITAGSFLSFCAAGTVGPLPSATIRVTDTVANVDLGSFTFTTIAPCS